MRTVVSISLPKDIASELKKVAKEGSRSKSGIIKEALREYLWETRFIRLRKIMSSKAEKKGILTDEDIFEVIS